MAKTGSRRKLKNGLTSKENAFTQKVLEQIVTTGEMNGTQAALEVYDTTDKRTAGVIAHENMKKPKISETIQEALEVQGLTQDKIVENIGRIAGAQAQKITDVTILKANIELLKLHNAYPDKKSMHLNLNIKGKVSDLGYSEAEKRLKELNQSSTIFMQDAEI